MTDSPDVLIVGGGPVGATLALALRGSGLAVTVLEAREQAARSEDRRTLALSEGSRQLLQRLGVWAALAPCATPIRTIHISQRGGLGRSVLQAEELRQEALGYVLPYAALSDALDQAVSAADDVRVWHGAKALTLETMPAAATVSYARAEVQSAMSAPLVVLADGGRSLDAIPGLQRTVRDYGQSALVGFVECDAPNRQVAYERFTPQGPVALLPSGEYGYALVWTAQPQAAADLCALDPVAFLQRLQQHFGDRAGRFVHISGRSTFPLKQSRVRPVTAPHLAVIGNAAQTLHPVAGQGFNLGLRDAWELAATVRECPPAELGGEAMLARYRQQRRPDTEGGMLFTDFLVRAFSNDIPGLGAARGAGLALVELFSPAKRFVARKMSFGAHG